MSDERKSGLLVVDKSTGMTSRAAVDCVKRWFPRGTKIGHTGTLDPLATGVLVVCIGSATRLADYVQAMSKSYTSRFRLGATSTTDDADGEVTANSDATPLLPETIEAILGSFVGVVQQTPPAFSALKLSGQRAYELARKGKEVALAPRPVRIDAIRIANFEWPYLDVEVDCGKGTYIRSIARDLGAQLGCGAFVETLRRTRIGPFTAAQGLSIDAHSAEVKLLPAAAALVGLRQISVDAECEKKLRCGQTIRLPKDGELWDEAEAEVALLGGSGELIGTAIRNGELLRPSIILNG